MFIASVESKFLFTADNHIKSRTWTNSMLLHSDAYAALGAASGWLTDKYQDSIQTLVIGGDWFDTDRPTSEDVLQSVEFLKRFHTVYYIRGNHDKKDPSFLELMKYMPDVDLVNLEGTTVFLTEDMQTAVTGINYTDSADELKSKIQICHDQAKSQNVETLYLVLHTSFKHLLNFGTSKLEIQDIEALFPDMVVRVLVGDVHTRDTVNICECNGSYIHSPGATYPTSIDKTSEEPAMSVIPVTGTQIEDVPCQVRMYWRIEYIDRSDLDSTVDAAMDAQVEGFLPPFIRVLLPEGKELKLLQSDYPDVVVQVTKMSAAGVETSEIRTRTEHESYTLKQAVSDEASEDADLCDLAVALLEADDPVAEISRWLEFWKVERLA